MDSKPQKRAPFIVIEGLDRSGKTTQTHLLHERLQGAGVATKLMKFPDRTTSIGKLIDSYLRSESDLDDHAIHLLFSANRWELASTITHLLNSGTAVLCDRYAFSGIAFSSSKQSLISSFSSPTRGHLTTRSDFSKTLEWCRAPDISLPAPDLTIFLDVTPDQAKLRGGYGEERYESEDLQRRVREVFIQLGEEMALDGKTWTVLDAGRAKDTIAEDLWRLVEPLTHGVEDNIGRLWENRLS